MAMGEEIIQLIVYIALAIIFSVVFSRKKKTDSKQQQIPQTKTNWDKEQNKNQKKSKEDTYFPPVEQETTTKNSRFTTMISSFSSELDDLETIEDEVESDHRLIKKKAILHEEKQKIEESFKITQEDLKKAVILSDIIRPKYF